MLGYDQAQDAQTITLLDLVAAIAETGASEDEVIATVAHLKSSMILRQTTFSEGTPPSRPCPSQT